MTKLTFPNAQQKAHNNASIPVGARVRVAAAFVDFFFFNMQETGVVESNSGNYLGIIVRFDQPIRYKSGGASDIHIKNKHGFNAEHLQLLPAEAHP